MIESIRQWLQEEGYQPATANVRMEPPASGALTVAFNPAPDDGRQPRFTYLIAWHEARKRLIVVAQLKIGGAHFLTINHDERFRHAATQKWRNFAAQLDLGLALRFDDQGRLTDYGYDRTIFGDAPITKQVLMQTLRAIYASIIWSLEDLNEQAQRTLGP